MTELYRNLEKKTQGTLTKQSLSVSDNETLTTDVFILEQKQCPIALHAINSLPKP